MNRTRFVLPGVVAVLALLLLAGCTPMPYWQDEVIVLVPVPGPPPCPPPPVPGPYPQPVPDGGTVGSTPRHTPAAPAATTEVTKTRDRDTPASRGPARVDTGSGGTARDRTRTR